MPSKRTGFAPWSLTREAGVLSATVDGTIEVPQNVQPTLSTGFVDYKGNWQGAKSSDEVFFAFTKHLAVADGGETLSPATANRNFIDMTGFRDLQIAIKPTRSGNMAFIAVMGPDTNSYANLSPVRPAYDLKGNQSQTTPADFEDLFYDSGFPVAADVWNIFYIGDVLRNQKLLQFKIINNTGGSADMEVAFMRLL